MKYSVLDNRFSSLGIKPRKRIIESPENLKSFQSIMRFLERDAKALSPYASINDLKVKWGRSLSNGFGKYIIISYKNDPMFRVNLNQ